MDGIINLNLDRFFFYYKFGQQIGGWGETVPGMRKMAEIYSVYCYG